MQQETKICQNCKNEFVIEPEDFVFYEKMKVPPPTFCPECRLVRRLASRNERALYKRKCNAPGHNEMIISAFSADKKMKIYDQKYWWSDNWDPLEYGKDYDFQKKFFEQFGELFRTVPYANVNAQNNTDSEFVNHIMNSKNCYLVFGGQHNEQLFYSNRVWSCRESSDLYFCDQMDLCYEDVACQSCYRLFYSQHCEQCADSYFLYDCKNCAHCFGCVNLRNKQYCIFNRQYAKEEYEKKLKEFGEGGFQTTQKQKEDFEEFKLKFPHKFANLIKTIDTTGDNVRETKNCRYAFDVLSGGAENCKFIDFAGKALKDAYDCQSGANGELIYEAVSVVNNVSNVSFSMAVWSGHHVQYSYNCHNCNYIFGCVGLRNKQYCILNKQYSKEDYEALVPKIIEHMNDLPYTDKKGRVYKYGEFFPSELSPFCYNETIAQEYFPLTKEQAIEQGYSWKDPEPRNYQIDLTTDQLPDNIKDVPDDIVGKVIECGHQGKCQEQCTEAFRIIPQELQFYRRMNLPLPRLCPNCRHYQRLKQRNPLKLWKRNCQAPGCSNTFETSYAPDRPEIVYCEACYLKEVV